jgi:hypothetical protein
MSENFDASFQDVSAHRSGRSIDKTRLSKWDDRYLRRVFYPMTALMVSKKAFFKAYFLRRKRRRPAFSKSILCDASSADWGRFYDTFPATIFQSKGDSIEIVGPITLNVMPFLNGVDLNGESFLPQYWCFGLANFFPSVTKKVTFRLFRDSLE